MSHGICNQFWVKKLSLSYVLNELCVNHSPHKKVESNILFSRCFGKNSNENNGFSHIYSVFNQLLNSDADCGSTFRRVNFH